MFKQLFKINILIAIVTVCTFLQSSLTTRAKDSFTVIPLFMDCAFIGSSNAWILGYKNKILHTNNGGEAWATVTINSPDAFWRISFIDSDHGWGLTYEGQIWQTKDGGYNWKPIAQLKIKELFSPKQIHFIDKQHGWVIGLWAIWRTEDGGMSWEVGHPLKKLPPGKWNPYRCYFVDPLVGWLADSGGKIFHSKDGGRTWLEKGTWTNEPVFRIVYFLDSQTGWINGLPDAGLFRTDDGGKTWDLQLPQSLDEPLAIMSLMFVDKLEGWAVGKAWLGSGPEPDDVMINKEGWGGIARHSLDRGKRWRPVKVGENELYYQGVHFADRTHGWILSKNSVYRTDDAGKTWRRVLRAPSVQGVMSP